MHREVGNVWDQLAYTVILKFDDDIRRLEWSQSLISICFDDTNSKHISEGP